ncbi:hypothetical protein C7B65_11720 [Phormidesmis priestleyi ULC007]|uniref:Uncharacterized protein n=1 Tax=Phormidesmis priestleyi ULC007 TaxID=1920490 RepID=A0A2T1DFJ6_9CYAN|nr:hypothetical protein C7B65_11720 [Phormidesmis priestleyi ULC007]PZO48192.1 MAG: hypothetical protein DCF14_17840 [Phormidesmis priestleyi]
MKPSIATFMEEQLFLTPALDRYLINSQLILKFSKDRIRAFQYIDPTNFQSDSQMPLLLSRFRLNILL